MKLKTIRTKFLKQVSTICECKEKYVENPDTNFTRNRKISVFDTVLFNLSLQKSSLQEETYNFYGINKNTPTPSAMLQQNNKINEQLYIDLFKISNKTYKDKNYYQGYKLLAVDGSDIRIPTNKNDENTYFIAEKNSNGYNLLHLNALYDVLNKKFESILIESKRAMNENEAMIEMLNSFKSSSKSIIIGDRGYESYNNIAYLIENDFKFLIRSKLNGISKKYLNYDEDEIIVERIFTKSESKYYKENLQKYHILKSSSTFNYYNDNNCYKMKFKVVKIMLKTGEIEYLITNLFEFSINQLSEIYHLRWGIETSFRELKYSTYLNFFHFKTQKNIIKEIFSRVIFYNFSMFIALNIELDKNTKTKFKYQFNFTKTINICRQFLLSKIKITDDISDIIKQNILPVRPNRSFSRRKNQDTVVAFIYR